MFKFFRKKKPAPAEQNSDDRPPVATPSPVSTSPSAATTLSEHFRADLPEGMHLPEELDQLFNWLHAEGLIWQNGERMGGALTSYGSSETAPAPYIEFSAEGSDALKYWFGQESDEIKSRLYVFCQTGGDGSMGAFWLDDAGEQKIVHLGSGSGSTMVCVLADTALDFLRLLAVGYEEICWGGFDAPPSGESPLNTKFRTWIETTFSTHIPKLGNEIVKETAELGDEDKSNDPFLHWVSRMNAH